MAYLIGTDEAGYGPNLGPLVISATVWEAPDGIGAEDLFDRLGHLITPEPSRASLDGLPVAMADSKTLYSPATGLGRLERGLWAALGLLQHRPRTWRSVWQAVAPAALEHMRSIPWYADYDGPVPLELSRCPRITCGAGVSPARPAGTAAPPNSNVVMESLVEMLSTGLATVGVRLLALRSRAVFEPEFNQLVEQYGSKGSALSHQTLALAAEMIDALPPGPVSLVCDKHGGRNHYGPLLAEHFPGWWIEVRGEGQKRSNYRFGPSERRVDVCFRTQGESCLPAALASMASKYLRELAMRALNDYWRRRVPESAPHGRLPARRQALLRRHRRSTARIAHSRSGAMACQMSGYRVGYASA